MFSVYSKVYQVFFAFYCNKYSKTKQLLLGKLSNIIAGIQCLDVIKICLLVKIGRTGSRQIKKSLSKITIKQTTP